jgi:hypothetical protein
MFVMVKCGVVFEVRTEFLNIILTSFVFNELDQGFLQFSIVLEQMLSSWPNSTFHCISLMQSSQY